MKKTIEIDFIDSRNSYAYGQHCVVHVEVTAEVEYTTWTDSNGSQEYDLDEVVVTEVYATYESETGEILGEDSVYDKIEVDELEDLVEEEFLKGGY